MPSGGAVVFGILPKKQSNLLSRRSRGIWKGRKDALTSASPAAVAGVPEQGRGDAGRGSVQEGMPVPLLLSSRSR